MKRSLLLVALAVLIVPLVVHPTDSHISVQDTGTAKARTKSFTRTSDSAVVQMQLNQDSWLEMNFGNSAGGSGNQIFNEVTTNTTSAAISVTGTNLANYLAVTCECDDSDVDFYLRPGYVHYNATAKIAPGSVIPFDNTMANNAGQAANSGTSGFTTLETSFRPAGTATISTLGAKEMIFRVIITAGAAPRVSCWYSRL